MGTMGITSTLMVFLWVCFISVDGYMSMMAGRAGGLPRALPAPRTRAQLVSDFYEDLGGGSVRFGSRQMVEAILPGASTDTMYAYLHEDPGRILYACWDRNRLEREGDDSFRIFLRDQKFLTLSLDFSLDLKIWSDGERVHCKSTAWRADDLARALGQDFVDTFSLEMEGQLSVEERVTTVRSLAIKNAAFLGHVGVTVGGRLPSVLSMTPQPVVKAAGLGINAQVLNFASGVFVNTICADYRSWVQDNGDAIAAAAERERALRL